MPKHDIRFRPFEKPFVTHWKPERYLSASKRPCFGLQKAMFQSLKGHLWERDLPCIGIRHTRPCGKTGCKHESPRIFSVFREVPHASPETLVCRSRRRQKTTSFFDFSSLKSDISLNYAASHNLFLGTNRYLCSRLINTYIIRNEKTCFVSHRRFGDDWFIFYRERYLRFNVFPRTGKRRPALHLQL